MGLLPRKVILANTPQEREEGEEVPSSVTTPIPGLPCPTPALPRMAPRSLHDCAQDNRTAQSLRAQCQQTTLGPEVMDPPLHSHLSSRGDPGGRRVVWAPPATNCWCDPLDRQTRQSNKWGWYFPAWRRKKSTQLLLNDFR